MNKDTVIAIQGAMDGEIIVFLEAMESYTEEKHGNYSFYLGELKGIPVVISRTEIGMVNAAAATTLLIEKYQPTILLNQGTAGGHDPQLDVFDTIIGTEILHINSFMSSRSEEGAGMAPETWLPMKSFKREKKGNMIEFSTLESDKSLVEIAQALSPEYRYGKVVSGRIGTADFWNREIDRIHWFNQHMGTKGEEMEAFAAAQIAEAYDIPFLSIRTISNSEVVADDTEDLDAAGRYCAEFVMTVTEAIYQQMTVATN